MSARVGDALVAALKSIADENGLSRIDLGYAGYSRDRLAYVSIWFDAPDGILGHTTGGATNFDDAIAAALDAKTKQLATVREAA